MKNKIFLIVLTIILGNTAIAQKYQVPKTEWGVPDFQGVWKHATLMPFERPHELGEKRFYTEEEVLALETVVQQKFEENNQPLDPSRPAPEVADSLPPIGNYDLFWRDDAKFIPTIDGEFRTSAIIDPPNGRMPERIDGFDKRMQEFHGGRRGRSSNGPEGRGLGERCLVGFGNLAGPVMSPVIYNSHLQFTQSPGYVTITAEMVHDTRIVKITNERNPASDAHRKWMGDSIGRWEGETLIVETKNFNNWHTLRGMPVENMTITETFRRETGNKLIYGFTVDDPTIFSTQFSGEYPLSRINQPLYEYACHEGNYGMIGILAGARKIEELESQK